MRSLRGHLLVAAPSLMDPNFFHTVVLLIQHNDEGAFGVVLNRPTNSNVKEVWIQVSDDPTECEEPVFHGGPVSGPLVALHTVKRLSDVRVLSGVYCSMDRDKIEELFDSGDAKFKFFVGSAGWGPGQLEKELEEGSWLVTPAKADDVLSHDHELWLHVLRQIGESLVRKSLEVKDPPADPSLN